MAKEQEAEINPDNMEVMLAEKAEALQGINPCVLDGEELSWHLQIRVTA